MLTHTFALTGVRPVLDEPDACRTYEGTVDFGDIDVADVVYHARGPAHYAVVISHTGDGVLAVGTVTYEATVVCQRCLKDFDLTVEGTLEELFFDEPTVDDDGDPLPYIDEYGDIALLDELYEALRVEMPFAPLHSPACKGLCPVCGIDRNSATCDCANRPDPSNPFAGLADLLEGEEDD